MRLYLYIFIKPLPHRKSLQIFHRYRTDFSPIFSFSVTPIPIYHRNRCSSFGDVSKYITIYRRFRYCAYL